MLGTLLLALSLAAAQDAAEPAPAAEEPAAEESAADEPAAEEPAAEAHPEEVASKEPIIIALGGPLIGWGTYIPPGGGAVESNLILGLALGVEVAAKSDIGYLAFGRTHGTYMFGSERKGWDWGVITMAGPKLSVVAPLVGLDFTFSKREYHGTDYFGAWTIGVPFGVALDLRHFFTDVIYAPQWFIGNKNDRPSVDWSTRAFPGFGDEVRTFARVGLDLVAFNSWIGYESHAAAWGTQGQFYIGIGFGQRTSWSSLAN